MIIKEFIGIQILNNYMKFISETIEWKWNKINITIPQKIKY